MIIHVYPGNNDTRVVIPLRHCILRALVYLERHACRSPLTRTTRMDVSPGIIHVEEGEALFSKLDRAVQRHPATVTHAQYTDVFLSLPAARNAEHRRTRAPAFVLQNFCDRMQHLLSTSFVPLTVRWIDPKNPNHVTVASLSYVSPGSLRLLTETGVWAAPHCGHPTTVHKPVCCPPAGCCDTSTAEHRQSVAVGLQPNCTYVKKEAPVKD